MSNIPSNQQVARLRELHAKIMKGETAFVGSALQDAANEIERQHAALTGERGPTETKSEVEHLRDALGTVRKYLEGTSMATWIDGFFNGKPPKYSAHDYERVIAAGGNGWSTLERLRDMAMENHGFAHETSLDERIAHLGSDLAEAVSKDEAPDEGGFDLSAGMFGRHVSAWIRKLAGSPEETKPDPTVRCLCGWQGKVSELVKLDSRHECPACMAEFRPIDTLNRLPVKASPKSFWSKLDDLRAQQDAAPCLCGRGKDFHPWRFCSEYKPAQKASGPKPDAEKAPVISADPCPTGDWVHEEHNGKCVYCGAPMPSQSKASASRTCTLCDKPYVMIDDDKTFLCEDHKDCAVNGKGDV